MAPLWVPPIKSFTEMDDNNDNNMKLFLVDFMEVNILGYHFSIYIFYWYTLISVHKNQPEVTWSFVQIFYSARFPGVKAWIFVKEEQN